MLAAGPQPAEADIRPPEMDSRFDPERSLRLRRTTGIRFMQW
jgi:hypothetical protein